MAVSAKSTRIFVDKYQDGIVDMDSLSYVLKSYFWIIGILFYYFIFKRRKLDSTSIIGKFFEIVIFGGFACGAIVSVLIYLLAKLLYIIYSLRYPIYATVVFLAFCWIFTFFQKLLFEDNQVDRIEFFDDRFMQFMSFLAFAVVAFFFYNRYC